MRARLWLSGLALVALGACASTPDAQKAFEPGPLTPTEQYSIEVKPAPIELKLEAHLAGLSPAQAAALRGLAERWANDEPGAVTIKAPEHGPAPAAAYRTATDARDFLIAQGVQPADIRIVGYEAGGDQHAPVLVGLMRYLARGPQCGESWENLAHTPDNQPYANFGCAVTANLAAQIADPADLLAPRASTPPDATRRENVFDKYRQGATTSTAKDQQAVGTTTQGQ